MEMIVFGDKEVVTLFSLGGIEGHIVENSEEAIEALKRIRRSKKYGLVIVTKRVAIWAKEIVDQLRFSKELPVVVDVPDSGNYDTEGETLPDYIRKTIGVKI